MKRGAMRAAAGMCISGSVPAARRACLACWRLARDSAELFNPAVVVKKV